MQHDNQGDEFSIPMSELIPNLENFDPQILTLLPPKVRKGENVIQNQIKKFPIRFKLVVMYKNLHHPQNLDIFKGQQFNQDCYLAF